MAELEADKKVEFVLGDIQDNWDRTEGWQNEVRMQITLYNKHRVEELGEEGMTDDETATFVYGMCVARRRAAEMFGDAEVIEFLNWQKEEDRRNEE
jgi:hypothetical protein